MRPMLCCLVSAAAAFCFARAAVSANPPDGIRFIGNTWNQALIAVPPNSTHAVFVSEGGSLGGVKVHMLMPDKVVLDVGGKQYEVDAEPCAFSATWLNDYLTDTAKRIDQEHPYMARTVTFGITNAGQPFNYDDDATISAAYPYRRLPANMKSITVRVKTSPNIPTTIEALGIDMLK